jgi:hypothetical protein
MSKLCWGRPASTAPYGPCMQWLHATMHQLRDCRTMRCARPVAWNDLCSTKQLSAQQQAQMAISLRAQPATSTNNSGYSLS